MKTPAPLSKIEMIERSMSCFVLGLCSLLPVIGIPFAVVALLRGLRVAAGQGEMWNPAQRYLIVGRWLAWTTLLLTVATVVIISGMIASGAFF